MKGEKGLFNSIFARPKSLKWGPITMKISPLLPPTATNIISKAEDDSLISRQTAPFQIAVFSKYVVNLESKFFVFNMRLLKQKN